MTNPSRSQWYARLGILGIVAEQVWDHARDIGRQIHTGHILAALVTCALAAMIGYCRSLAPQLSGLHGQQANVDGNGD